MSLRDNNSPIREVRSPLRILVESLINIWNGLKFILLQPFFWFLLLWLAIWAVILKG